VLAEKSPRDAPSDRVIPHRKKVVFLQGVMGGKDRGKRQDLQKEMTPATNSPALPSPGGLQGVETSTVQKKKEEVPAPPVQVCYRGEGVLGPRETQIPIALLDLLSKGQKRGPRGIEEKKKKATIASAAKGKN